MAIMARTFLKEQQINNRCPAEGTLPNLARTLTAPMPQVLLVTLDGRLAADAVCVRTATLGPLTWGPYTKYVNIPNNDEKVARCLQPGAQCVLGLPSRAMLRPLAICRQRLPRGISEAAVARLKLCKSLCVDVPSIQDCPVNLECVIDHVEPYHTHVIAFVRVVGASIDDKYLFWDRGRIIQTYPTNFADETADQSGAVHMRVSLLKDIYPCPTFPLGQKAGWGDSFDKWVRDLADEKYLSRNEQAQVGGWHRRWNELFTDVQSPERAALKKKLDALCRLLVAAEWDKVHAFLAANR